MAEYGYWDLVLKKWIPRTKTEPAYDYDSVLASTTDHVVGLDQIGNILHKLVVVVTTALTSQVQIKDGNGSAFTIFPNNPGGGIGVYPIELNMVSTLGGWKVTTGAGVSVLAIGRFT